MKWLAAVVLIGVAAAAYLVTMLNYLYWTPVGDVGVQGMQGRYYIPLIPALAFLLCEASIMRSASRRKAGIIENTVRPGLSPDLLAVGFAFASCTITLWCVYQRYYG